MTYWVKSASGDWEGPVTIEVLQGWIGTGQLQRDTLVRKDGEDTMEAAFLNPFLRFPKGPPRPASVAEAVVRNPAIRDERLRRFSWSAFTFTWLWGIYHRKHVLLLLVPFGWAMRESLPFWGYVAVVVLASVVVGMQGNQWAWESERFATLEAMAECEDAWHRAAMKFLIGAAVLYVLMELSCSSRPQTPRYYPSSDGVYRMR